MTHLCRCLVLVGIGLGTLALAPAAMAGHKQDPRTKNLHPLGHIVEPAVLGGFGGANPDINTDIAFQGKLAFQGNWDGFSIRDISAPGNPRTVSRTFCDGNQGDVLVYRNILVRSWNTPAGTPGAFGAGLTCDGQSVPAGFEGLHVFDISNLADPVLVADIELSARPQADSFGCGSHTATAVPDPANGRLLVYNSSSTSPACDWIDIISVPLANPAGAAFVRREPSMHTCHDIGVILGDVMKAACAGGTGFRVFSLGGAAGGSLTDPALLYHVDEPGVTVGHSASWTWDGEVIIFGHEPGGGVAAECEATDPTVNKSFFFHDADTGALLGTWVLPRAQGPTENCTLHNYNVVPTRNGRDILVSGNYQAGTWVVDFTNPSAARTVAWSDPPPKPVPPGTPFCCDVTGAWSSYWYNGFIYESNIGEGLNVFNLSGREKASAMRLDRSNPQTQEFSID
jgi:LVIVD repeat